MAAPAVLIPLIAAAAQAAPRMAGSAPTIGRVTNYARSGASPHIRSFVQGYDRFLQEMMKRFNAGGFSSQGGKLPASFPYPKEITDLVRQRGMDTVRGGVERLRLKEGQSPIEKLLQQLSDKSLNPRKIENPAVRSLIQFMSELGGKPKQVNPAAALLPALFKRYPEWNKPQKPDAITY